MGSGVAAKSRDANIAAESAAAARVAALSAERSWPLHAHVSEQRAENDDCDSAYGVTPTGLLAGADALTERAIRDQDPDPPGLGGDLDQAGGAGGSSCGRTARRSRSGRRARSGTPA